MQNKPYDKNKIGKFIGWGGEHLVFAYGANSVIKFSLHVWLSDQSAVEKLKKDYELGQKYFGQYILPTDILTWKNSRKAVEIQEKIECRFLAKQDLSSQGGQATPLIKKQFDDIMQRYQKMEQETGLLFDLFGREGLLSLRPNKISNILVTPDGKIILIDFTILELKPLIREIPLWLIVQWAKRRQGRLLKKFLK
ncbi:MAG: hypothetical protein ABIH48_01380 [Candidatus Falkowbacteria bacterium]|nr:hypothetical protein [Patescibacteria group bacterium]